MLVPKRPTNPPPIIHTSQPARTNALHTALSTEKKESGSHGPHGKQTELGALSLTNMRNRSRSPRATGRRIMDPVVMPERGLLASTAAYLKPKHTKGEKQKKY